MPKMGFAHPARNLLYDLLYAWLGRKSHHEQPKKPA
jgi:hypothetical protein